MLQRRLESLSVRECDDEQVPETLNEGFRRPLYLELARLRVLPPDVEFTVDGVDPQFEAGDRVEQHLVAGQAAVGPADESLAGEAGVELLLERQRLVQPQGFALAAGLFEDEAAVLGEFGRRDAADERGRDALRLGRLGFRRVGERRERFEREARPRVPRVGRVGERVGQAERLFRVWHQNICFFRCRNPAASFAARPASV